MVYNAPTKQWKYCPEQDDKRLRVTNVIVPRALKGITLNNFSRCYFGEVFDVFGNQPVKNISNNFSHSLVAKPAFSVLWLSKVFPPIANRM